MSDQDMPPGATGDGYCGPCLEAIMAAATQALGGRTKVALCNACRVLASAGPSNRDGGVTHVSTGGTGGTGGAGGGPTFATGGVSGPFAVRVGGVAGVASEGVASGRQSWTEAEIKAAFRHHFAGEQEDFEAAWATFRSNLP
jgi:hypothetical protein